MKGQYGFKFLLLSLIFNLILPAYSAFSYPLILTDILPNNLIDEKFLTEDKQKLIQGINHSLRYLETAKAREVYASYPLKEFSRERVIASLKRFRELLINSQTPQQLQAAVEREFVFYQSVGNDNQGTVHFTGYFQPLYDASRQKTDVFPYPLYRKPSHFDSWQNPHPSRVDLEGKDGLGNDSLIKGYELVWLRDRLQAYLVGICAITPNGW